ncbi:class I SAM-dependent methyltransferase [uncultured Brevibacillus sp.]|uniref:class I SAM-dependent methyltransferase n=1 Tax=uncultured Brevibacillus sp. TaxID=169970 RepID=UPI0025918DE5|nr:methyltransferase domain-containing protein [uncultured Brevibacillus sp.]
MSDRPKSMSASAFWIAAWERAMQTDLRVSDDTEEEKFWEEYAPLYDERNPLAPYAEALMDAVYSQLAPDDHILEVGPGTGGFTQLLAPYVGKITLVEPSASMYREFHTSWQKTGYLLPEVLAEKWEEVEGIHADVLFSANAVYRIRDMRAALLKMNQTAKRHVFLIQSIGRPFAGPLSLTCSDHLYEQERAVVIAEILDELAIQHTYRIFPVERKNGMRHEVALIHWEP